MRQAELEARFADALIDPSRPVPQGLTSARGEADTLRFAVYRNNVHVSLVEALGRAFPVARQIVGTEFFRAMARAYVAEHKPRSAILIGYGDTLPDFIAGFAPAARLPYLADVARLECAWNQAYHAADAEPLAAPALADIPPAKLASARIVAHPATRLVASPYAIGSIWSAHQGDGAVRVNAGGAETVLVTRPHAEVRATVLPPADAPFIEALLEGASIEDAAERTIVADSAFDPAKALTGLVALGALIKVQTILEETVR